MSIDRGAEVADFRGTKLEFPLEGVSLTYLFTFDLGSIDGIPLSDSDLLHRFGEFVSTSYVVSQNEIRSYRAGSPRLLETYKEEMYEERFRTSVLPQRTSLMVQIPTKDAVGLFHPREELVPADQVVRVDLTCTLNSIGVGSIAMWVQLEQLGPFSFEQLRSLREVDSLTTSVDWRLGRGDGIRLLGTYCLADLAKFVIIAMYCTLSDSLSAESINRQLSSDALTSVHAAACTKVNASTSVDHYPIIHIDLAQGRGFATDAVSEFIKLNGAFVRGLVTGDANWNRKKPEVVSDFMDACSFSTRSSLFWFTHTNGSLKLYSSDLETPLLTSKTLIVFELELVLTMRYCLHKLIANLNPLSILPRNSFPLRRLTKLRDQELRRLDDYYNLDILQKDTTAKRLTSFRKMLNIDEIHQIADRKFGSINSYMATEYQNASAQRQFILTVIFGIFGAGTLTFNLLREAVTRQALRLEYWQHLGWVGLAMLVIALLIYRFFNRLRMQ